MSGSLKIIVTGLIAQHPTLGGVTWDYLQYAIGLARLGHDVYYFEDSGEWPYNLDGGPSGNDWVAHDCTPNVAHLLKVLSRYGLGDKWAYRFPTQPQWFGLSAAKRSAVLSSADLLINVSGTLERPGEYRQVPRLAYIDSDPVFTQLKLASGQSDFCQRVDTHDVHFSFGEWLSEAVPVTGHQWRPTRTPIVLSEWRSNQPRREVFTTVMSWTSYKPLTYQGLSYGQKDVELKQFLELPAKVNPVALEVAIGRTHHVNWETDDRSLPPAVCEFLRAKPLLTPRELLANFGWRLADAGECCVDLDSYRNYIESSKAEWSVAKNGYVAGKPGWFSCRSACYLAAGRPVVVQDTGFRIPTGEGVLAFSNLEEAVAAIREVEGGYQRHAEAAQAIAEEYFDSDKVLGQLLEQAMTNESGRNTNGA
jgi:hypothetical protein